MNGMITQGDAPLALGCVVKPLRGKEGTSSPLLGQNLELLKFGFRISKVELPNTKPVSPIIRMSEFEFRISAA